MKAISKLQFLFLSVMLCILPACNINNNVVSDTEYLTEIDLSPAPAQDKSDAMDKSFALMATLGADALAGSEGLTLVLL